MTHDARSCTRRAGPIRNQQDRHREPLRNQEEGGERRGRGARRVGSDHHLGHRDQPKFPATVVGPHEPSPKRKLVRRNLQAELGDTVVEEEERRVAKGATNEWVRKAFTTEKGQADPKPNELTATIDHTEKAGGSGIHSISWYRNTEEEAAVAKLVYAQNETWEKVEGTLRRSEEVKKEPAIDAKEVRGLQTGRPGRDRDAEERLYGKGLQRPAAELGQTHHGSRRAQSVLVAASKQRVDVPTRRATKPRTPADLHTVPPVRYHAVAGPCSYEAPLL